MVLVQPTVVVSGEEDARLREAAETLHAHAEAGARLLLEDGSVVMLSPAVTDALGHLVATLATGQEVAIGPLVGYSPVEAMHFLGASPSYVARVLEAGELPYRLVDFQPRIAHGDLVAHRAKLRALMREGIRAIQQLSEEEGAYDEW